MEMYLFKNITLYAKARAYSALNRRYANVS